MRYGESIKNLVFKSLAFVFFGTLQIAGRCETSEIKQQIYDVSQETLNESGFFEKLEIGASIGEQRSAQQPAATSLEERSKSFPSNPKALILWGKDQLKGSSTGLQAIKTQILNRFSGSSPDDSTEVPSARVSVQEANFKDFKLCAAKILPLMKHLLGALDLDRHTEAARYFMEIRESTGQSMGSTQNGEFICGHLLGGLVPRFKFVDRVQMIGYEVIALSMLSRFDHVSDPALKNALAALWLSLSKNSELNRFGSSYWQYLSVEMLARNKTPTMSPEDFAKSVKIAVPPTVTRGFATFNQLFSQVKFAP